MSHLSGKRILIVDDEFLIAMHAEEFLTDLGAVPVGPACTIEEALTFIDAREFDAVLLDANLHNRSSEPVAQRLARESIPYVVVTGYNAISWQTAPAKLVAKPYTDLEIADALRAVLHSPVGSV